MTLVMTHFLSATVRILRELPTELVLGEAKEFNLEVLLVLS
jgi:hypothetical protein